MNPTFATHSRTPAKPPPRALATPYHVRAPVLMRTPGACACGGSCPRCSGATRGSIPIGRADDAYEREADAIARQVMEPLRDGDAVHAQASDDRVAEKHDPGGTQPMEAPAIVHDVLRDSGRPLDASSRGFFEPRFGRDLSAVRVHTDSRAERSAQAVAARAYTVGSHMVFGAGEWKPDDAEGRRLIAHELAHTLQQSPGRAPMLHGQFEGPKAPPAPTDCRVDPFAAARIAAGDKTAALQVVSCCIDIPKLGNGCTSQLADAACALLPNLPVCKKPDNPPKTNCGLGFKPARSKELVGQCCPESSTIEMANECCEPSQMITVGGRSQCCPAGKRPNPERTACAEPLPLCPADKPTPLKQPGPRVQPQPVCDCQPPSRRNEKANLCCPAGQDGSSGTCTQPPVKPPAPPAQQSTVSATFDVFFNRDAPQTWYDPKTSYDVSVTSTGKGQFDALVARLQGHAEEKVQLEGRASSEKPAADAEYNKRLTDRRATLITSELARRKIDASRLDTAPGQADAGCEALSTGVLSCGDTGAPKDEARPDDRKVVAKVFAPAAATAPAAAAPAAPAAETPQP